MYLTKIVTGSIALSMGLIASPVLAATPQQSLNQALLKKASGPVRMVGTADIKMVKKIINNSKLADTSDVRFSLTQRALGADQTEGRLSLDKLITSGSDSFKLDGPISVQWKTSGDTAYLRVENVPQSLVAMLKESGFDPTPYIGTWYGVTGTDMKDFLGGVQSMGSLKTPTSVLGTTLNQKDLKAFANRPIFLVNSVEKRIKDKDGHTVLRLRVRINPAFISALRNFELSKIGQGADRSQKIKELNAKYAEINKFIAKTRFVAMVDQTANELDRIEFSVTNVEPIKTCSWNSTGTRETCRNTGSNTTTALVGISMLKDPGTPIQIPASYVPLRDLVAPLLTGLIK